MKRVLLLFALIAAINCYSETSNLTKIDKSKIVQIDTSDAKIDSSIVSIYLDQATQDTAFQNKLINQLEIQKEKHKGNFFFDNLFWICFIFVVLFGAVVANIKTKKALRWLQPLQEIFKWIFEYIIVPENKRK